MTNANGLTYIAAAGLALGLSSGVFAQKFKMQAVPATPLLQMMSCSQPLASFDHPIWEDITRVDVPGIAGKIAKEIKKEVYQGDNNAVPYCYEAARYFLEREVEKSPKCNLSDLFELRSITNILYIFKEQKMWIYGAEMNKWSMSHYRKVQEKCVKKAGFDSTKSPVRSVGN